LIGLVSAPHGRGVGIFKHHHHHHPHPHNPHHHHHHHLAVMELGHLLTLPGLIHPEVSSVVSPGSSSLLVCSFLLSSVICYMLLLNTVK
jgi:hypothetical protein